VYIFRRYLSGGGISNGIERRGWMVQSQIGLTRKPITLKKVKDITQLRWGHRQGEALGKRGRKK